MDRNTASTGFKGKALKLGMFCPDRRTSDTSCGSDELEVRNMHLSGLISS